MYALQLLSSCCGRLGTTMSRDMAEAKNVISSNMCTGNHRLFHMLSCIMVSFSRAPLFSVF